MRPVDSMSLRMCIFLGALLLATVPSTSLSDTTLLMRQARILELDISEEFSAEDRAELAAWVKFISTSLEQVYGHWPTRRWRITVSPASAAGADPIPWAQVHRESLDRVEFFVAPGTTARRLRQEWTGYHELAHLLIPYRGWGDFWFSEGLATYYQNLLRRRAGVLDEQAMWQAFVDGFERGAGDDAFDGQALHSVSNAMHERGGFMRVYWSGAWYFLKADARLRQQSSGRLTLDDALQKLNKCCAHTRLSVPEMVAKLDALNQVFVFQPLYDRLRATTSMPDTSSLLASLGVSVISGQVVLQDNGPGARLRAEIARPDTL